MKPVKKAGDLVLIGAFRVLINLALFVALTRWPLAASGIGYALHACVAAALFAVAVPYLEGLFLPPLFLKLGLVRAAPLDKPAEGPPS
jgi:hypothetical protein